MTDRATSTLLSYTLTLSIAALIVAGVLVSAGGFVDDEIERSARAELEVVGNRIASDVAAVDRLAMADADSTVRLSVALPTHVAGQSYRIEFVDLAGSRASVNLSTTDPAIDVAVTVNLDNSIRETSLSGGDILLMYDGTQLEVARD